jgi:hypothetical protein
MKNLFLLLSIVLALVGAYCMVTGDKIGMAIFFALAAFNHSVYVDKRLSEHGAED